MELPMNMHLGDNEIATGTNSFVCVKGTKQVALLLALVLPRLKYAQAWFGTTSIATGLPREREGRVFLLVVRRTRTYFTSMGGQTIGQRKAR
jgi:hypothetical protein